MICLAVAALPACLDAPLAIPAAARETGPASAQSKQFGELFDAVVKTTSDNFYNRDILRRSDWDQRAKTMRSSVVNAKNLPDAVGRINDLLGELKTSHTALYTPDQHQFYTLLDIVGLKSDPTEFTQRTFWADTIHYAGIGIFTAPRDGRHFVDGVMEGSPAARAGVLFGDEIVSVDGTPYRPMASFRGKIGQLAKIEIRRTAGAPTQTVEALVVPIRPAAAFTAATAASTRLIKRDGRLIGYVHAWSVHSPEGLTSALGKLPDLVAKATNKARSEVDALILDMRGRVGGQINVAENYLDLINTPAKPYWGKTEYTSRNRTSGNPHRDGEPANPSFRGRTVMLIDGNTRSAGEMVALGFKKAGLGLLVGTRTAGAVSGGAAFLMPGDNLLYVATSGLAFDGAPIEGRGVAPDVIAERPVPYAAGADPVLDRGLSIAARLPASSTATTQ